jgi:hypothetical protein
VKQELGATDKQLQKIDKQLQRLKERAALEKLKGESVAYKKAMEDLARAQGKLTVELSKQQKVFNAMGSFSNKANEIGQFAGSVIGGAKALLEFAQAGAEAAAVAATFDSLGAAVPTLEALKDATAGVVSETTLQGYAKLASDLGLTAEEMSGLAQRATALAGSQGRLGDTSEILNKMLKGEAEGLRDVGIAVDLSAAKFQGLTEAEKKLAVAQEQAALGSQEQVDSLDENQVAMLAASTSIEDMVSNLSVMIAEVVSGSGLLETLGSIIGILDNAFTLFAPAISAVGQGLKFVADVSEIMLGPQLALIKAIMDQRTAHEDAAKFIKGHVEALVALREEQMKHAGASKEFAFGFKASAAGAREMVSEINNLDATLEFAVGSFDDLSSAQINALQKTRDFEQSGKALEDMIFAVTDAKDQFDAMDEAVARQILGNQAYDEVSARLSRRILQLSDVHDDYLDIVDLSSDATNKNADARDKNADAARDQAAANVELIGVLQTMIAQFGVLADATITDAAAQAETMIARQALLDLVNSGQQALNETARQTFELGAALAEQTVLDIENLQRKNELIAEANELQAAQVDGMGALAKAGSLMAVSIGGQTDKWGALNSAIVGSAAAFKQAGTAQEKIGATLSAGKAITASVVDDTTTQAAILGAFEVAEAAANFANPPAAVAHGLAAALYFGVAAKGGKGGGGGGASAGAGTASAAAAQTPTTQIIEEPTLPSQSFGVTNFFNVESTNPDTAGDNILSALNAFTESGSGALLSPDLIGDSQGRSGL